jgi:hypothetical protein
MNIAFLYFVYNNPIIIKRTISRLNSDKCKFIIHVDRKADITQFNEICGENIFFCKNRIAVHWGEFSGIKAIISLVREGLKICKEFDYFVLLSGSEYPIKSREYIFNYFEKNTPSEFISMIKMPNMEAGKPISRINEIRIQSEMPVKRFAFRILSKIGFAKRNYKEHLNELEPYAGNTWWALTNDACRYILEFISKNEQYCKYFENTFAPEEMFFHTILGNSKFKTKIKRNIMYEDWSNRGSHPKMINDYHVEYFINNKNVITSDYFGNGENIFARKFSNLNMNLLEKIDQMIIRD